MGFFSSRKSSDDNITTSASTSTAAAPTPPEKGVVQVIRSRFYGKQKGKEREQQASAASFKPHGVSVADALSKPIPPLPSPQTTPLKRGITIRTAPLSSAGPSKPRSYHDLRVRPSSPTKGRGTPLQYSTTKSLPASPVHTRDNSFTPTSVMGVPSSPGSKLRKQTDNVTVTLAQRLNELATANTEGLLNDDEYRLLRQNLFERFSTTTAVPTENPVVPVARTRPRPAGSTPISRPTSGVTSNFQVDFNTHRPPSVQSKSSLASGVTSLLRRATGRRTASGSKDFSDTSSMVSNQSSSSKFFKLPRALTKKSSSASVHTVASRQADAVSITGMGSTSDHMSHLSHSGTRSLTGSIRRQANPPSSYRALGTDSRFAGSTSNVFNDEHLQTSQEIQDEITAVQAEAKRLMDAFHGLELTTMTKNQRRPRLGIPFPSEEGAQGPDSPWTLTSDGQYQRRVPLGDSDTMSVKSGTSTNTSPSMSRSAYSSRRAGVVRGKSLVTSLALNNGSRPGSIHRKGSFSSVASQERRPMKSSAAPPVPALPTAYGHLTASNASSVSLARSAGHGYTMAAVPENDSTSVSLMVAPVVDSEVEDIRRRREEVQSRYDARLEYLRAKLKGAQLHEKLVKK
ncbi:hypothetical protein BDN72DRAFT_896505 [Pluteus cervinus]|uniref:Uncharacterized protein n=1 Tax=Pluteus cervinus TaxID=181527 RepID=A0ACD3AXN9_9AGAR|nr:hypothetical protein BDN72DRAFT_896505 [Pluteus cervinus]